MHEQQSCVSKKLELSPRQVLRWHIGPQFLMQREVTDVENALHVRGLTWKDFTKLDPAIRRQVAYKTVFAPTSGIFTFPPATLFIGQTIEFAEIPEDKQARMRLYFEDERIGLVLPLCTNLSAEVLHPGARGPQAVEIYNELQEAITVHLPDLVCVVDMFPLDQPSLNGGHTKGNFPVQYHGEIQLGEVIYNGELRRTTRP